MKPPVLRSGGSAGSKDRAATPATHSSAHHLAYPDSADAAQEVAPAGPPARCAGHAGEAATLVMAVRLRAAFGGMPGDVQMLQGFAGLWAARRAPYCTPCRQICHAAAKHAVHCLALALVGRIAMPAG